MSFQFQHHFCFPLRLGSEIDLNLHPSFVTYYGVLGPSLNFPGSQFPHLWDGIKLESSSNKIFAESGEMMSTAEPCLALNRLSESAVPPLLLL